MRFNALESGVLRRRVDGVNYEVLSSFGSHEIRIAVPAIPTTGDMISPLSPVIDTSPFKGFSVRVMWVSPRVNSIEYGKFVTWGEENPFDKERQYLSDKLVVGGGLNVVSSTQVSVHWPSYKDENEIVDTDESDSYGAMNQSPKFFGYGDYGDPPFFKLPWNVGFQESAYTAAEPFVVPKWYYRDIFREGFDWVDQTGKKPMPPTVRVLLADISTGTWWAQKEEDTYFDQGYQEIKDLVNKIPTYCAWLVSNEYVAEKLPWELESLNKWSKLYVPHLDSYDGSPYVEPNSAYIAFQIAIKDIVKWLGQMSIIASEADGVGYPIYESQSVEVK